MSIEESWFALYIIRKVLNYDNNRKTKILKKNKPKSVLELEQEHKNQNRIIQRTKCSLKKASRRGCCLLPRLSKCMLMRSRDGVSKENGAKETRGQ